MPRLDPGGYNSEAIARQQRAYGNRNPKRMELLEKVEAAFEAEVLPAVKAIADVLKRGTPTEKLRAARMILEGVRILGNTRIEIDDKRKAVLGGDVESEAGLRTPESFLKALKDLPPQFQREMAAELHRSAERIERKMEKEEEAIEVPVVPERDPLETL